jgi:hypothetical protein
MRKIWKVLPGLVLLASTPTVYGEDPNPPPATTLQEISRQAEERLKQWDEEERLEEKLESSNWVLQVLNLAVGLILGHALYRGSVRAASFTPSHGLSFQFQPATRAPGQ